jgi:hypothetical protein
MADDWRLEITVAEGNGVLHNLTERMEASELEHDLETAFADRLVVSRDGETVFCYAGTREQAEAAGVAIDRLAQEHGWKLQRELRRWHPTAEEWEDPDAPLPTSGSAVAEEHAELIESEREDAQEQGYPDFEVRVEFSSHHEAKAFAERLEGEGVPHVRRWKYLLIAAADEDSANALAERLRGEAGSGATVIAEGSGQAAFNDRPSNPFAFLGGLAG